jgi:hypothetical protein
MAARSLRTMFCLMCLVIAASAQVCHTTLPPDPPFVPPSPYWPSTHPGQFWYGSAALWTLLGSREWTNPRGKIPGTLLSWWSQDFDWRKESQPALLVIAKRLDADGPVVSGSNANSAFVTTVRPGMMVGLTIPTAGCWEITGTYRGTSLSFVVRVMP